MKKIIFTDKAPKPIGPYSQAVIAGNFIFLSGQIGICPETGTLVPGSIKAETKCVLENIKAVLEAAGSAMNNVVKTTVYLTDLNNFIDMNNIYNEYFIEKFPARATIQVGALPKGACVEIEAIALKTE